MMCSLNGKKGTPQDFAAIRGNGTGMPNNVRRQFVTRAQNRRHDTRSLPSAFSLLICVRRSSLGGISVDGPVATLCFASGIHHQLFVDLARLAQDHSEAFYLL